MTRSARRPAKYPMPEPEHDGEMALKQARDLFFLGKRDAEWFEKAVEAILMGGHLDSRGAIVYGSCTVWNPSLDPIMFLAKDHDLVYAKVTITDSPFPEPTMERILKP